MSEVKWVKLDVNIFDSPKIKYLRNLPNGEKIILVWIMLIVLAGKCNANGKIFVTKNIFFDENSLANELNLPKKIVSNALKEFRKLNMIESSELTITGWAEHQSVDRLEELKEAHRKANKEYYQRKKNSDENRISENIRNRITDKEEEREEEREGENICNPDYLPTREEPVDNFGAEPLKPIGKVGSMDVYICPHCGKETVLMHGKCNHCRREVVI